MVSKSKLFFGHKKIKETSKLKNGAQFYGILEKIEVNFGIKCVFQYFWRKEYGKFQTNIKQSMYNSIQSKDKQKVKQDHSKTQKKKVKVFFLA